MRNFSSAYEFDPNTYGGEGGGLLGRLKAVMQQNQPQQGIDPGSTPSVALEYNPDNYGSPQGGLLGRLLSLQAEQGQYQPIPGNSEFGLSGPSDPNFRQLSRGPTVDRPQGAIASNPPDDRLGPAYSPLGADRAVQPDRSFSDRLQAWWDHPDPRGMVAVLKEALNGVAHAVQGSIDATSTPSTEEEAFRQNQGREFGPAGAWKAASLLSPTTPGGAGGIMASPVVGALRNGLPWLPAGARIAGRGAQGPVIAGLEERFPDAVNWLRNARTGDVPGVLSHPELGDRRVDLIFGTQKYGVAHIDSKHPGELDKLPENWSSILKRDEGPSRIVMENGDRVRAVIPKDLDDEPKNWLLTYYDKNRSDRPGSKSLDSASAQDRAVPFPDRPAGADLARDWQFLNALREPASLALSRTVSSALGGINPIDAQALPQLSNSGGLPEIVSGEPMPHWLLPPPIRGPRRQSNAS